MTAGTPRVAPDLLVPLLEIRRRPVITRIVVLFSLWAALGWCVLQTPSIVARLGIWAVMGFVINGLVQLAHESWHENLFLRKGPNVAFGTFLGLLVGISHRALQHDHLMHHRHNRTVRDPDAFNAGRDTVGQRLLFYAVVVFGLPLSVVYFNVLYPLQWFDRRELPGHFARVLAAALGYLALFACLAHLGWLSSALWVWLVPVLATSPYNGLKSIADHHDNVWNGDRFETATTVRSNRIVTWMWSGLNYHLDHHLYPRVPGYNLPALHQHLRPALLERGAPVFDSYPRVMWAALRAGPLVVEDDVTLVTVRHKGGSEGGPS